MGPFILATWLTVTPAPPGSIEIDWAGPADCANADGLHDRVIELLGADTSVRLEASATVEPLRTGFRLSLVIDQGAGHVVREVEAQTCAELLQAAALIIAVAANPEPVEDEPPPPGTTTDPPPSPRPEEPLPSAEPTVEPPPHDRDAPASTPPRGRPRRSWVSLAPELGLGTYVTTPLTIGVGGRIGWRRGSWGIELSATHWLGRVLSIDRSAEIGLSLTHGSLRGCAVPTARRVELPLCGGASMGVFNARPRQGLEDPRPSAIPWGAITAAAGAVVPLTRRWAVAVHAEALFPVVRPAVAVDTRGAPLALYRVPPLAGRLVLGVEFRLP